MMKMTMLLPLTLAVMSGAALAADAPNKAANAPTEKVRDWNKIDLNKDGSISPEEMEKFLAENPGPQKK